MARPYTLTTISQFKGLTSAIDKAGLAPNEFSNLVNFNINQGGYLEKRKGIYRYSSVHPQPAGVQLRLMAISRGIGAIGDQFWLTDGSKIYRVNQAATVWSTVQWAGADLTTAPKWMIERKISSDYYAMAIVRTDNPPFFIKYDGTVIAGFAGPVGTHCADWKGRMWVINSVGTNGQESNVDFSGPEDWQTWYPNTAAGVIAINPGDGQFCTALQVYNDSLYVFKDRSIWVINGESEPSSFAPRLVHATLGCIGRGTVQLIDGFMYFLSGEGVYRTDGTTFEELSQPIRNEFWNQDYQAQSMVLENDACYFDNKYILALGMTTTTLYVYDTVSESWSMWKPSALHPVQLRGMFSYQERGPERFYAGSDGGRGYLMTCGDEWYQDDTSGLLAGPSTSDVIGYATTAEFTEEVPGEWKRNHFISLDCFGVQNQTQIYLTAKKDRGINAPQAIKSLTTQTSARTQVRFPGVGRFRSMYLELEARDDTAFRLYGITLANEVKNPMGKHAP